MARDGYGRGRKQVQVWVSPELHGAMRAAAGADSVTLQGWMVSAFREKVSRDGFGGVESGFAGSAPAVERGSGRAGGRDGADHVGVGAGDGGQPGVTPDWAAIMEAGRAKKEPVYLVDTVETDPLEEIA